jgi:hypothetical protein
MMWGDIAVNNPEITRNLPRDLIVLSWGYDAKPSFKHAIQPFTRLGFDFWVCPGVSCWGRIWPDFGIARINIHNYIRDGYRHGAQECSIQPGMIPAKISLLTIGFPWPGQPNAPGIHLLPMPERRNAKDAGMDLQMPAIIGFSPLPGSGSPKNCRN